MKRAHYLKTDPEPFCAVWDGVKTHEIRFNDRAFWVGHQLVLQETRYSAAEMKEGRHLELTGRAIYADVTHIQTGYGLCADWIIMSIHVKCRVG